jgi:glycosyltransferase involved in cell wall biosynthesis
MRLTVTLEARYAVTPDGSVWSRFGMDRHFWERYLEVFDTVRIVARGVPVDRVPGGAVKVNSDHIVFHRVPDFQGPWEYLKRYRSIRSAILAAAPGGGAVILRVGSQIANMMARKLHEKNYPYALEVVGDPHEVFAPGVVDHPLRPLFRWHFTRHLRRQCLRAIGVAYVTKRVLQQRYPSRSVSASVSDVDLPAEAILTGAFSTHYSNVDLDSIGIAEYPCKVSPQGAFQVVTVGSLAQLYKGTDVLIDAIAHCIRAGLDLTAVIVGDGKYKARLMSQAERLGLNSRIRFTGQVTSGLAVRNVLDSSALFVLPSRTEGLPRALIEAMARGLPCIGTDVGGIPELLDPSELVRPGDAIALSRKIQEVLRDPARMRAMSQRNLAAVQEFCDHTIAERRTAFYRHVRDFTERWESRRGQTDASASRS